MNISWVGTLVTIDDAPAITARIKRIARPCGYQPLGNRILRRSSGMSNGRPDLTCINLAMPGTDGIELVRSAGKI
ncbi:MAG TPA: hypothetical protein VF776_04300 [Sphingomicrobium sp.]